MFPLPWIFRRPSPSGRNSSFCREVWCATLQKSVIPGIKAKIEGVGSDTMRWTSKYGSAAMVSFEGAATDGLNGKRAWRDSRHVRLCPTHTFSIILRR